jgi:superfamily II DNA/RNA helicase
MPGAQQNDDMFKQGSSSNDMPSMNVQEQMLPGYVTESRFEDQPDLSSNTKKALQKILKLERMTEIQVKTLQPIISGKVGTVTGAHPQTQ